MKIKSNGHQDSAQVIAKQRQMTPDKDKPGLECRLATIQSELEAKCLEKQTLSRDQANITDTLTMGGTLTPSAPCCALPSPVLAMP